MREAVVVALFESVAANPQRSGNPLRGELEGLHAARRGDFRLLYEILEEERVVLLHRAAHRADVYRRR